MVDKRSFYNTTLTDKGINHVGQLVDTNGATKPWSVFQSEFSLSKTIISTGFMKETKIYTTSPLADTISKCNSKEL